MIGRYRLLITARASRANIMCTDIDNGDYYANGVAEMRPYACVAGLDWDE